MKAFYVPRSNPDGFSVNVRCLDRATIARSTCCPSTARTGSRRPAALRSCRAADPARCTRSLWSEMSSACASGRMGLHSPRSAFVVARRSASLHASRRAPAPPPVPTKVTPLSSGTPGGPYPGGWHIEAARVPQAQRLPDGRRQRHDGGGRYGRGSASGLVDFVDIDPHERPILTWRWKIIQPVAGAETTQRSGDDAPARILLSFAGDVESLPFAERLWFNQVKLISASGPLRHPGVCLGRWRADGDGGGQQLHVAHPYPAGGQHPGTVEPVGDRDARRGGRLPPCVGEEPAASQPWLCGPTRTRPARAPRATMVT